MAQVIPTGSQATAPPLIPVNTGLGISLLQQAARNRIAQQPIPTVVPHTAIPLPYTMPSPDQFPSAHTPTISAMPNPVVSGLPSADDLAANAWQGAAQARMQRGGGGGNYGPAFSGNTHSPAQVNAWVHKALQIMGLSDAYAPGVENIIMHESSGNPDSVNNWDINAKEGHPSQGLMQTIPSTFASYALPGYNQNILNPIDNIIAGIRYAKSRYGLGMVMAGGRKNPITGAYEGY